MARKIKPEVIPPEVDALTTDQERFCQLYVCGGTIEQQFAGYDRQGNQQYKPHCTKCHNTNIPQLILGGGVAGGG